MEKYVNDANFFRTVKKYATENDMLADGIKQIVWKMNQDMYNFSRCRCMQYNIATWRGRIEKDRSSFDAWWSKFDDHELNHNS